MPRVREEVIPVPNMGCNLGWNIHSSTRHRLSELDQALEECYTWVREVLVEAKKTMSSPEIQLLPKTPSAKRAKNNFTQAGTSIKMIEEESTEDEELNPKKKSRKGTGSKKGKCKKNVYLKEDASTTEGTEESEGPSSSRSTRSNHSTRSTRAASQRSTRSTRAHNTSKKSTESTEPILRLSLAVGGHPCTEGSDSDMENDSLDEGVRRLSTEKCVVEQMEPSTSEPEDALPAAEDIPIEAGSSTSITDVSTHQVQTMSAHTPKHTPKQNSKSNTPASGAKTVAVSSPRPIPGFRLLNVKDKAQAFESFTNNSVTESSIHVSSDDDGRTMSPKTPVVNKKISQDVDHVPDTPKHSEQSSMTVLELSCDSAESVDEESDKEDIHNEYSDMEEEPEESAPKQVVRKKSDIRKSMRKSSFDRPRVSVGLKTSMSKRRSSLLRHKLLAAAKVSSAKKPSEAVAKLNASLASLMNTATTKTVAPPVRSTRSKLRLNKTRPKSLAEDDETDSPAPTQQGRSTRSKVRQNQAPPQLAAEDISSDTEEKTPERPLRTTRSKVKTNMGPPPRLGTPASDGTPPGDIGQAPSTMAPVRSTRSKMKRLQQQAAGSPSCFNQTVDREKRGVTKSSEHDASPPKKHCTPENMASPKYDQPIHPRSFLSSLKKKVTPGVLNTTVKSFIQRNTPQKTTQKDIIDIKRKELAEKDKKDENRIQKRQEMMHRRAEEQKKRREEKQQMAAKRRGEQIKRERDLKNHKMETSSLASRVLDEKLKEERDKQKLREKRMAEAEQRRKHEEELRLQRQKEMEEDQRRQEEYMRRKKEFEEQERQRKIVEQLRQAEERAAEQEKERQREAERLRQAEEETRKAEGERQRQKDDRERREREERERAERERQNDKERLRLAEIEKQKEAEKRLLTKQAKEQASRQQHQNQEEKKMLAMIEKHNHALQQNSSLNASNQGTIYSASKPTLAKPILNISNDSTAAKANSTMTKEPQLNTTVTKEEECESYDLTPVRKVYTKSQSEENYDIGDMNSDDSTDDEEAPRKKIPKWAQGPQLRSALIVQHYQPPDLDKIFDTILPPDLNELFVKRKPRFNKRTSSACWNSPIFKPSGKPADLF